MIDKIMQRVLKKESGCWEWQGALTNGGYGRVHDSRCGKTRLTHRVVFEEVHGFLPEVVMHICDNTKCCNPEHLINGTAQMNSDDCRRKRRDGNRGLNWKGKLGKTHCKQGHELSGYNLKVIVVAGYARRRCRRCGLDAYKRYANTAHGKAVISAGVKRREKRL